MADNQNTSFIPKNANRTNRKVRTTRRIYILSYLSYVFFFGTLMATLAIFFYSVQVSKSLEAAEQNLNEQKNRISLTEIDGVRNLEKKILTTSELVSELSAPSQIFNDIEELIAENVFLTAFSYIRNENGTFSLELKGQARALNPILFQRALFKRSGIFLDSLVTDFDYAVNELKGVGEDQNSTTEAERDDMAVKLISLLGGEPPVITFSYYTTAPLNTINYEPVAEAKIPENEVMSVRPVEEEQDIASTEETNSQSE